MGGSFLNVNRINQDYPFWTGILVGYKVDYKRYINKLKYFMDKGFLSHELNHLGLLESLDKAYHIQEHLRENYPDMEDADTKIIAVWRHRRIGRWRRPRRHVYKAS